MGTFVSGLATTAVKGMRLGAVPRIELGALGARGNRAFYVIDQRGRMVNGKQFGELQTVLTDYDLDGGELTLTFPNGAIARGRVGYGETLETRFFSRTYAARLVVGPWAEALSELIGQPLRIVEPETGAEPETAVDRGRVGGASLISRASVQHLAQLAAEDSVDVRRFRMLIEVDGVGPHEEDSWVGHRVRIGPALVAMHGNVGRCLVTSRDPESGEIDLPTLDLLGRYRRSVRSTEPLPLGIYGEVLEPGAISIGDPVMVDG
jgi:hypothetical protein